MDCNEVMKGVVDELMLNRSKILGQNEKCVLTKGVVCDKYKKQEYGEGGLALTNFMHQYKMLRAWSKHLRMAILRSERV